MYSTFISIKFDSLQTRRRFTGELNLMKKQLLLFTSALRFQRIQNDKKSITNKEKNEKVKWQFQADLFRKLRKENFNADISF